MKKALLYLAVAALAFAIGIGLKNRLTTGTTTNALLTEFTLPDLHGDSHTGREWHGKIRLINFWATWCPPCRKEIPELNALQQEYRDQGFIVIGIALDEQQAVTDYLKTTTIAYPVLLAAEQGLSLSQASGNLLGVIPFSVLVDQQDRIRFVWAGEITRAKILEQLALLTAQTK